MPKVFNRSIQVLGELYVVSPGGTQVRVLETGPVDDGTTNKYVTKAQGNTKPVDAEIGYARGCYFTKLNGTVATALYINEGDHTSCDFNAMETSASTITSVAAGNGLTGGGTEGAVTLNVGATDSTVTVGADGIKVASGGVSNTELAAIARGSVKVGGVANAPTDLVAKTSGNILVGDGTDIKSVAVSGDATLAANGALTVGNNGTYVEVALTKANILAMNGAPVEVIAAQAGKAIEILSAVLIYDYSTDAYGGGGDVSLIYAGGVVVTGVVTAANSLGAAADKIAYVQPAVPTNNQLLAATAIQITNATGAFTDPGTAAGVARLQISYRTHTTGL